MFDSLILNLVVISFPVAAIGYWVINAANKNNSIRVFVRTSK